MQTFIHNWEGQYSYGGHTYHDQHNWTFNFDTTRQLLSEWVSGSSEYYLNVQITGTVDSGSNHTVINNSNFTVTTQADQNKNIVSGLYFRYPVVEPNVGISVVDQFGDDPEADVHGAYSAFSYDCGYDKNSTNWEDNDYTFTLNGDEYYGPLALLDNEDVTVHAIIAHLLDEIQRHYTSLDDTTSNLTINIDTNIPYWDTYQHMVDFINNGSTVGLLNAVQIYQEDHFEYFIKDVITKNGDMLHYYDYKFITDSPIDPHCLYLLANNGIGYDYVLHGLSDAHIIEIKSRNRHDAASDYAPTSTAPTEYLKNNQLTVSGDDYQVNFWRTNIYAFRDQNAADNYAATGDASDAINQEEVIRSNDEVIDGHIGDVVSNTENGSSGISFSYGSQIYACSNIQLAAFFENVLFNPDPNILDAILEGTQLFGANQINAITGIMYLPIDDINEIATTSTVSNCHIGTYQATLNAKRVLKNDKMIDCGSAFFKETYGDVRDYEPFCRIFVMLPYCGTHALQISKYINKTVKIKYAVDVTTGACTAYIYANDVIMDSFDGSMGVQRPLMAVNQQAHVAAVTNGVLSTGQSAIRTVGSAGAAALGAVGGLSQETALMEATKMGAKSGSGIIDTIVSGYNTLQADLDEPMTTRGAFSGNLGGFGVQSPYFVFAWLKTSKPDNETELVGLPSNAGGTVGSFGGYLKCSSFSLANGFTGTQEEANEIINQMLAGVYVS